MNINETARNLKTMFIKVHIITLTWAFIAGLLNGLTTAILTFLVLLHLIVFTIHFLDIRKLTLNEILRKIRNQENGKAEIFESMRKSRSRKNPR